MKISFEILGAICGADCLEKNPFRKFKGPFPNLGKPSLSYQQKINDKIDHFYQIVLAL